MRIDKLAGEIAAKAAKAKKPETIEAPKQPWQPTKADGLPQIYYDAPKRAFWAQNARGEWTEYPGAHIRLMLIKAGISGKHIEDEGMSKVEGNFLRIRQEHDVQWAGALAGFQPGVYEVCGTRILVTSGPRLLKAKKGEWPTLAKLLGELLGEQEEYLYGWIKSAIRSLLSGRPFRPGQAMAIAGPRDCGKSLLQGILTEIFGGRIAKPYRYLSGETPFNGELLAAEHLMIEDEAASTDLRTRRHFGAQLKNLIANEVISFHQKGRQAMSFTPFWRVSITLNEEAENLMVLPPLDESMKDKIFLLKAFKAEFPFTTDNLKERAAYRAKLTSELPAFLDFLSSWRVPSRMADKRYGVRAWQNPELLQELEQLQPEFRLLELIDTLYIWGIDSTEWMGTASELRQQLEDKDRRGEVARLLAFNTAAGVYLGRLSRTLPGRITKRRGEGNVTIWVIRRSV